MVRDRPGKSFYRGGEQLRGRSAAAAAVTSLADTQIVTATPVTALFGKRAAALWRSRPRIVCGVERPSLALERIAVDALGQALEIRIRDAARSEVLPPSADGPRDANDFGSRLRRRVAKELALRHGNG